MIFIFIEIQIYTYNIFILLYNVQYVCVNCYVCQTIYNHGLNKIETQYAITSRYIVNNENKYKLKHCSHVLMGLNGQNMMLEFTMS